MTSLSTAEHLEHLIEEYKTYVDELGDRIDSSDLQSILMSQGEWTRTGSAVIEHLARQYGSFVLSNALALAEALDIEDGDAGI